MTPADSSGDTSGLSFELFLPKRNRWAAITDARTEPNRVFWFEPRKIIDFEDGHIVLSRVESEAGALIRFLGRIEKINDSYRLTSSDVILRSTTNDTRSKRQDFRIGESDAGTAFFRIPGMADKEPSVEAPIDDISAGGIGMIITDDQLQKLQLATKFRISIDITDRTDENPNEPADPDILEITALLKNIRPLRGQKFHFGLQYSHENMTEVAVNRMTTKLLRFVAIQQREALRRRSRLDKP